MSTRLVLGCLAMLGGGVLACTPEASEGNQLAVVNAGVKPVDISSSGARGRVLFARKAPPLRRATEDEIEELNGTFRTPGSRDRILRRIESADAAHRDQLIGLYNRAIDNLASNERDQAKAKLDQAILQSRPTN
jgi:hypothetical protein